MDGARDTAWPAAPYDRKGLKGALDDLSSGTRIMKKTAPPPIIPSPRRGHHRPSISWVERGEALLCMSNDSPMRNSPSFSTGLAERRIGGNPFLNEDNINQVTGNQSEKGGAFHT